MANSDSRPLGGLISDLVSDISSLFRKEIDLAKTEASAKISHAASGLGMFAVARPCRRRDRRFARRDREGSGGIADRSRFHRGEW